MKVTVNFEKNIGKIKAMHGIGQPPRYGNSDELLHYLTEAHIPYSRLHDVGAGEFADCLYVDVPNIFRDFDADVDDPDSYDFAFTDQLIEQLYKAKCEPIYRLGTTIENNSHIRAYRIYPPADFEKWAKICEHIIRHYNEGWADGYHYGIIYWEIWNEADGINSRTNTPEMWLGTPEEFYRLYTVASTHLKNCFGDSIKVGGPANCGFFDIFRDPERFIEEIRPQNIPENSMHCLNFSLGFLDYISKSGAPLDFYSWHAYAQPEEMSVLYRYANRVLEHYGFAGVEQQVNEWNPDGARHLRGSSQAAANAAAFMIMGQGEKDVEILCYYDGRISPSSFGGLFNPLTFEPFCAYYSFKAFGELYDMGTQVEVEYENVPKIHVLAATDGKRKGVIIVNRNEGCQIETNLTGMKMKLIDSDHMFSEIELDSSSFFIDKNQVVYLYTE